MSAALSTLSVSLCNQTERLVICTYSITACIPFGKISISRLEFCRSDCSALLRSHVFGVYFRVENLETRRFLRMRAKFYHRSHLTEPRYAGVYVDYYLCYVEVYMLIAVFPGKICMNIISAESE